VARPVTLSVLLTMLAAVRIPCLADVVSHNLTSISFFQGSPCCQIYIGADCTFNAANNECDVGSMAYSITWLGFALNVGQVLSLPPSFPPPLLQSFLPPLLPLFHPPPPLSSLLLPRRPQFRKVPHSLK
jgi:hypothetical protein